MACKICKICNNEFITKVSNKRFCSTECFSLHRKEYGKPNISFSELTTWHNCSWKHYLDQVLKLDPNLPGIYADYGKALHAGHEFFILRGELDKKLFVKTLYDLWNEHAKILPDKFTTETFKELATIGKETLDEIPSFYNKSFPGWKPIDAEHKLLEPIDNHPHVFKGYIDAVIEVPQKKKMLNYIIDAKTYSWVGRKKKNLMKWFVLN